MICHVITEYTLPATLHWVQSFRLLFGSLVEGELPIFNIRRSSRLRTGHFRYVEYFPSSNFDGGSLVEISEPLGGAIAVIVQYRLGLYGTS